MHPEIQLNNSKFPVNTTPLLKDLQPYFTSQYAVQWRVIGTQLGLPSTTLDIIEHDNHYKAKECCNAMLNNGGYKWTPLPPGSNCLLSLSHLQCAAVLLIKVISFVYTYALRS